MRLIDADVLMDNISKKPSLNLFIHAKNIEAAIDETPTIDAEPVVRCKDCKHYSCGTCEQIEYIMDGYYRGTFEVKRPDDFCSCGERMVKHD